MNGYKILKCFRKEKRVSGELPCPATGLIILAGNEDMLKISNEFEFGQIGPLTTEFSVVFDPLILFILAGNKVMHKISDEFKF